MNSPEQPPDLEIIIERVLVFARQNLRAVVVVCAVLFGICAAPMGLLMVLSAPFRMNWLLALLAGVSFVLTGAGSLCVGIYLWRTRPSTNRQSDEQ